MITYYPGVTDFQSAMRVVVRGKNVDLGEVRLVRQKQFKVSGTIVRPGSRVATNGITSLQFFVLFHDAGSPEDVFPIGRSQTVRNTEDMRFEIAGLPAGTHGLYPGLIRGGMRAAFETPRTEVAIRDQDIEGLRIFLPEGVSPTGRVVLDESAATLLRNIRLVLRSAEPILAGIQSVSTRRAITPDARSGEFALENLSDGIRYSLVVEGLPADGYVNDIRLNNLSIFNDSSFVASTREQRLEVEIRTKGGIVRGIVRDATNDAVEKATVVLVPEQPRRGNPMLYKRTTTDASGSFTFNGVAPGDYQVLALRLAPPAGAEEDVEYLMPYFGRGATVRGAPGVTSETQLRVIEP
jgi:hypothetical protein